MALGVPPAMDVLPPISDRAGNVYVLAGSRKAPDTAAFVAAAGGGVSAGCHLSKGDAVGPIGWVGFAQDRAFYWAGNALVQLRGTGDCRHMLDRDPITGTDLAFRAVFPWVADRPSRTTLVAMVQAPSDPLPSTVVVDLDAGVYTLPRAFDPPSATDMVTLGVGASATLRQGFLVTSYEQGDDVHVEARIYDEYGALLSRAAVPDADKLGALSLAGFLQANDNGLVAGLANDKRVLLFDRSGARWASPAGIDPVGVHVWNGSLFVVGTAGSQPALAPISDSGSIGAATTWASSQRAAASIAHALEVTDDRAPPRRSTTFAGPESANGPFPLVTAHASNAYAKDTTLMLVAGPTFGEGAAAGALLAFVPVGVSYP